MSDTPATPDQPGPGPQNAGLRTAVRLGGLALVVLTVISVIAWTLVDGVPGLWGAVIGAGIGGAFVLTTAVVVMATARTAPQTTAAILLGTWLLKLVVAIGVVAVIERFDFYSRPAFAVTIIAALVVVLAAETWGILKTRTPYIEPADPTVI